MGFGQGAPLQTASLLTAAGKVGLGGVKEQDGRHTAGPRRRPQSSAISSALSFPFWGPAISFVGSPNPIQINSTHLVIQLFHPINLQKCYPDPLLPSHPASPSAHCFIDAFLYKWVKLLVPGCTAGLRDLGTGPGSPGS